MIIGQEQLMRLQGKRVHPDPAPAPDSIFWRIIYNAFYLWLAAVVGLCAWIAIF